MADDNNGVDYTSAPATFADLYRIYYRYVVTLVRRLGIDDNRKEDVAQDILLRLYERDILTMFDPDMVFVYDGVEHPARFKSFLTKQVMSYVRGHLDKQVRQNGRELLIADKPVGEAGDTTWIEVFGGAVDGADTDVLAALGEQNLVDELRAYIATVPRRSKFDSCDLPALYEAMIGQVREHGVWNVAELRDRFGVSSTAMHTWMWWLRANLAHALDRPVPPRRPRTVKPR